MSKTPKYRGVTLQWFYNTKQIEAFVEKRGLRNLMVERDLRNLLHKCIEHSKRLSRAYRKRKIKRHDYRSN